MPANKNAMTRYQILDSLLSDRYHSYSLDDLTEKVSDQLAHLDPNSDGVCRRTIEKDIEYLEYESPFYVELERYSASYYNKEKQKDAVKKCLRYAQPGFSIFKKELSPDEKYLLSEAMSLIGQFDGLPNLEALEGLRLSLGVKRTDKKIISFTKNPLENSTLLGELFLSISNKQVIELHYHKFSSPEKTLIVNLHPYLLKEYSRRWYLFAAAEDDGKLLCFALDRIDQVVPLPSHKYVEYEGDINERFEDIIGVTNYENKNVERIVFWVSDQSKDYVATKPLHDSQKMFRGEKERGLRQNYPMLENGLFFQIECRENYELIRELCSFGKELIVLEPSLIKEEIISRISNTLEQYLDSNIK